MNIFIMNMCVTTHVYILVPWIKINVNTMVTVIPTAFIYPSPYSEDTQNSDPGVFLDYKKCKKVLLSFDARATHIE